MKMLVLSTGVYVSNNSGKSSELVIWRSKHVTYLAVWRLAQPLNLHQGLQEHSTRDTHREEGWPRISPIRAEALSSPVSPFTPAGG